MMFDESVKSFPIDIVHQDVVVAMGKVTDQCFLVQCIACLKLFFQGCHIARVCPKLGLEAFQEVKFPVQTDTIALAGCTIDWQQFGIGKLLWNT